MAAAGGRPTPVTLGQRSDDFVVIETGLAGGEVVSLRDPEAPATGCRKKEGAS